MNDETIKIADYEVLDDNYVKSAPSGGGVFGGILAEQEFVCLRCFALIRDARLAPRGASEMSIEDRVAKAAVINARVMHDRWHAAINSAS